MTRGRDELTRGQLSADLLAQILETSPIGIVVADRSGAITLVNERATEVVDGDPSSLVGRNVFEEAWEATDVEGEPVSPEANPFALALEGESTYGQRICITLPDERRTVLRMNTSPIHGEDGTVAYAVATLEDVTAVDRRQNELAAKNRQLESLASVLSHDLRNPLAVARGYTDLTQETGDLALLKKVEVAHDRMEELVDSLLLLAKRGHAIGQTEPVALVTSARAAWESVATREATFDVGTELETVVADRVRLQQLFENLFRNSIEHGSDDVTVTVRRLEAGDGFVVEDDGSGIPGLDEPLGLAAYLDRSSTTEGLGLEIVNAIAEAHGWKPTVAPREHGGVRFEFDVGAVVDDE
jgi:PAS domain S-box-containing protein